MTSHVARRGLLGLAAAVPAAASAALPGPTHQTNATLRTVTGGPPPKRNPIPKKRLVGVASSQLHWLREPQAVVDLAKAAGIEAIEWSVHEGGHVSPATVERDLPRVVDLTRRAGLSVESIETAIQDVKSPRAEAIVSAASGLGINQYSSSNYFRYDFNGDIVRQIEDLKPRFASIASLNMKYGSAIRYNNNSAPDAIGGMIWDIWLAMKDFDPSLVGLNYDTGHAVVDTSRIGWVDIATIARSQIRALSVSDFRWLRREGVNRGVVEGWLPKFGPQGDGLVPLKSMLELLGETDFSGPVVLRYGHDGLVEGVVGEARLDISRERFLAGVREDLSYLRSVMLESRFAL